MMMMIYRTWWAWWGLIGWAIIVFWWWWRRVIGVAIGRRWWQWRWRWRRRRWIWRWSGGLGWRVGPQSTLIVRWTHLSLTKAVKFRPRFKTKIIYAGNFTSFLKKTLNKRYQMKHTQNRKNNNEGINNNNNNKLFLLFWGRGRRRRRITFWEGERKENEFQSEIPIREIRGGDPFCLGNPMVSYIQGGLGYGFV